MQMKYKTKIVKTFHKPYHFLNQGRHQYSQCLAEIFQNFHLRDFREEIVLWKLLALSSDQRAYDEGHERSKMIKFIHELYRLIEAFHIINVKINRQKKNDQVLKLLDGYEAKLFHIDLPIMLSTKESKNPGRVLKHFTKTFKHSYAKIEILDLLDAVITYKGNKQVNRENLILFYQHVSYLIRLAYSASEELLNR